MPRACARLPLHRSPHRPTAAVPLARARSDITRVQSAAAAPRSGPPARHARRQLVREGGAEGGGARAAVSRAVPCRDASGWQPGCHGSAAQVGTAVTAARSYPAPRDGARLCGDGGCEPAARQLSRFARGAVVMRRGKGAGGISLQRSGRSGGRGDAAAVAVPSGGRRGAARRVRGGAAGGCRRAERPRRGRRVAPARCRRLVPAAARLRAAALSTSGYGARFLAAPFRGCNAVSLRFPPCKALIVHLFWATFPRTAVIAACASNTCR